MIKKYVPIFNYPLLGLIQGYSILLKVNLLTSEDEDKIFEVNKGIANLITFYGNWNVGLLVFLSFENDLNYLILSLKNALGNKLEKVGLVKLNQLSFCSVKFSNERKKRSEVDIKFNENVRTRLVPLEKNILKILAKNANLPFSKIASEINESPQKILYHMKRLRKDNIILQFRPVLALEGAIIIIYVKLKIPDEKTLKRLSYFAKSVCDVDAFAVTFGIFDFVFQVMCKDSKEVQRFLEEVRIQTVGNFESMEILYYNQEKIREIMPFS